MGWRMTYMGRKLAVGVASVSLVTGVLGLTAVGAGASGGPNATNASITCDAFSGTATFSPPLKSAPPSNEKVSITGTVSGCDAQGLGEAVPSGTLKASATIDLASQGPNLCDNLTDFSEFPSSGAAKIKWSVPLSSGATVFTIHPIGFGVDGSNHFGIGLHANQYGTPPATGSFQGSYGGAYDSFGADGPTLTKAASRCESAAGLSQVSLKTPQFSPLLTFGGPNPE